MFKALKNYISEVRQRRADFKKDGGSLDFAKMLDDAQKERDRLWENPPPCGSVIRYVQNSVYEDVHGEFLFNAVDVEQTLKETLQEYPHLANGDEGAMRNWVQGRDESITGATDVPSIWSQFQYVADDLVRAGKAEIFCSKCEAVIAPDQIATNDDKWKRGSNFDRVVCQQGHNLLVVESVHLMM